MLSTENIPLEEGCSLGQQTFGGLRYAIQTCKELTVPSGMTTCGKGGEQKC